jgi:hypothetical protein
MKHWLRHSLAAALDALVIAYLKRQFLGETGGCYPKAKLVRKPLPMEYYA